MQQSDKRARLVVQADVLKESLGDLFGIFFEDINHAADGGLYAEMVQNRSFEFDTIDNRNYHALYAWKKVEQGDLCAEISVNTKEPFCKKNPHYIHLKASGKAAKEEFCKKDRAQSFAGICNQGFNDGMEIKQNEDYFFTCYAHTVDGKKHQLGIFLVDADFDKEMDLSQNQKNTVLGSAVLDVDGESWSKYEIVIQAKKASHTGRLVLTLFEEGEIALDFVSLFPKHTFCGRKNGMRADLAEILLEMKPKFMRFPGGCLVHDGSLDADARDSMYRWKNTIGPVECRPARRSNWGYNQTLGLGFFEYFQFCEDIKAKPLPVLPGGYDPHHKRAVPIEELKPWIQDALDLIEFANGDESTEWGKKRAEMGHPAPFGLEYLGIGNEEVGDAFFERYPYFHRAIKEKYPEIKLINTASPFCAGTEYEKGWKSARECKSDLIDEHYYMAPEWFLAHHHRYDDFSKNDPKVFLGEYASWGNTWWNALVEASYMIGLERNAKAVGLACYAPLFANVSYVNWRPDMIWFDQYRTYRTPNYYVQKLFMNYQGTRRLGIEAKNLGDIEKTPNFMAGEIHFKGNTAKVEFSDIFVENTETGKKQQFENCIIEENSEKNLGNFGLEHYRISCKAKEITGVQGFTIQFGFLDEQNCYQVTFGGWQNLDLFVTRKINGKGCDLTEGWFEVEKGRIYDICIDVSPEKIMVSIDGNQYLCTELKETMIEPLYYGASLDEKEGCVIIKAANLKEKAFDAEVVLEGCGVPRRVIAHTIAAEPEKENNFEQPFGVSPTEKELPSGKRSWEYIFAPMSLTIFQVWF